MKKTFDPRFPWATPLAERPVERKHLAALDFVNGLSLNEIRVKHRYSSKSNVNRAIRKVLSQEQIEARNKKFGCWHGGLGGEFRNPHMLERTVQLRQAGMTLEQIAKLEGIKIRAVCARLSRAKKLGLF